MPLNDQRDVTRVSFHEGPELDHPSSEISRPSISATDGSYASFYKKHGNLEVPLDIRKISTESREPLVSNSRSGWKSLSSLEKALSVALGLVSVLSVALMIAVIIVGVKLNIDDYKTPDKITQPTEYPPWVTTVSTSQKPDVTTRERPTTTPKTTPAMNTLETCMSNECFRAAGEIRLSLNPFIDPCQDFYSFACGGWIKSNPVTQDTSEITQKTRMMDKLQLDLKDILESLQPELDLSPMSKAKEFYASCIQSTEQSESNIQILRLVEESLRNFPTDENETYSLFTVLGELRRDLGANYIFSLKIDSDINNHQMNAVYLDHPELGISPVQSNNTNDLSDYKDLIVKTWVKIFPQIALETRERIADSIIDFETQLSQVIKSNPGEIKMCDYTHEKIPNNSDLSNSTEGESWRVFVDEVFRDILRECNLTGDCESFTVIQRNPEFFQDIDTILYHTDLTIIGDYLRWRMIQDFASDADESFSKPFELFKQKVYGYAAGPECPTHRWKYCVTKTNMFFSSIITVAYIKENVQDFMSFHEDVSSIVESVELGFYGMIQDTPWIASNETLNLILNELEDLRIVSGFSIDLMEDNSTEYYSNLNLTNPSSYLENVVDLIKWKCENEFKTVFDDREKTIIMHDMDFQGRVSAFYSSLSNSMFFPMGIWQSPTFRDMNTNAIALNYGSIGTLVGRKLIEVLENSASKYINGTLITMWDEETINKYENSTDCLKSIIELENDTIIDYEDEAKLNAIQLGGLISAFKAYERDNRVTHENQKLPGLDYTPKQIFFLGYAQTMCTAYPRGKMSQKSNEIHLRVKETLENNEEFLSAWKCPSPQIQNICRVW